MSVAAIGTTAPRLPTRGETQYPQTQPNTAQTGGYHNNVFRSVGASPQKLSVSRIPDIVSRMQTETKSSSAKKARWYKNENYVDPRTYSWRNLALFSDYQAHMWTEEGGIKAGFKK